MEKALGSVWENLFPNPNFSIFHAPCSRRSSNIVDHEAYLQDHLRRRGNAFLLGNCNVEILDAYLLAYGDN